MPKILAWVITFNFINIAWVFFRAKEWDDAVKVLSGMFGLSDIVFTQKHEKFLGFMNSFDTVSFGIVTEHIGDGNEILNYLLLAFVIILFGINTNELGRRFKRDIWTATWTGLVFIYILVSMNKITEFLYFNF
ncbi:MAG: hypothetical protein GQ474_04335 [Sulfurimonas sp.]|nr:hypothetical protein [Sulfurimonas sp.]